MPNDDPLDKIISPADVARMRAELTKEQLPGLPWPPPPGWDWKRIGDQIREELAGIKKALRDFAGTAVQRASLESHRRRLEQRLSRWKRICFFSGWRPWYWREPPEGE